MPRDIESNIDEINYEDYFLNYNKQAVYEG